MNKNKPLYSLDRHPHFFIGEKPEYITVLGGESLKAAKALVKKSEQAIKAAIVPEARASKWHKDKPKSEAIEETPSYAEPQHGQTILTPSFRFNTPPS